MKSLDIASIRGWSTLSRYGVTVPTSISTMCPYCNERVAYTLTSHTYDGRRRTASSSSVCPSCRESAHFWCTGIYLDLEGTVHSAEAIYIRPEPAEFMDVDKFEEGLPAPLVRSYRSAIQSYNAGNHVATTVCCNRALEGIFQHLLPKDKHGLTLVAAVDEAMKSIDFARPMSRVAHVIRDGGPLASHFAMEQDSSHEVSRAMIELLENLIEYLYVLPEEFDRLENTLGKAA